MSVNNGFISLVPADMPQRQYHVEGRFLVDSETNRRWKISSPSGSGDRLSNMSQSQIDQLASKVADYLECGGVHLGNDSSKAILKSDHVDLYQGERLQRVDFDQTGSSKKRMTTVFSFAEGEADAAYQFQSIQRIISSAGAALKSSSEQISTESESEESVDAKPLASRVSTFDSEEELQDKKSEDTEPLALRVSKLAKSSFETVKMGAATAAVGAGAALFKLGNLVKAAASWIFPGTARMLKGDQPEPEIELSLEPEVKVSVPEMQDSLNEMMSALCEVRLSEKLAKDDDGLETKQLVYLPGANEFRALSSSELAELTVAALTRIDLLEHVYSMLGEGIDLIGPGVKWTGPYIVGSEIRDASQIDTGDIARLLEQAEWATKLLSPSKHSAPSPRRRSVKRLKRRVTALNQGMDKVLGMCKGALAVCRDTHTMSQLRSFYTRVYPNGDRVKVSQSKKAQLLIQPIDKENGTAYPAKDVLSPKSDRISGLVKRVGANVSGSKKMDDSEMQKVGVNLQMVTGAMEPLAKGIRDYLELCMNSEQALSADLAKDFHTKLVAAWKIIEAEDAKGTSFDTDWAHIAAAWKEIGQMAETLAGVENAAA